MTTRCWASRIAWPCVLGGLAVLVAGAAAAGEPRNPGRPAPPVPPFFPARVLWQVALGAPASPPAVHDGTQLYVALRTGTVTAWTLDAGLPRWTARLDARGPLATDGARLFVPVDQAIEALAPSDGTALWRTPVPDARVIALAAAANLVVAVLEDGVVQALRPDTGARQWRHALEGPSRAAPVAAGDALFLARTAGEVRAVRASDGELLWTTVVDGDVRGFAAREGRLYFGTTAKAFYCLNATSGKIEWRWRVGAVVVGAPIVDEHHVYLVALDNQVRALDRISGAQRWRKPLAARPIGSPVPTGNGVATAVLAPELAGVAARDGATQGRHPLERELASPPLVVDRPYARGGEVLVLLLSDGLVLALQRRVEPPVVPLAALPGLPVSLTPPPAPAAAPPP